MKLKRISWSGLISILKDMATKLRSYEIDAIIGVGVSGLVPAIMLRRLLNINEFYVMTVKHYSDEKPPKIVAKHPILIQTPDANVIREKKLLVVDDFTNTGETLRLVKEFLIESGALEVITAVVVKRSNRADVDVYGIHVEYCVLFPWECL